MIDKSIFSSSTIPDAQKDFNIKSEDYSANSLSRDLTQSESWDQDLIAKELPLEKVEDLETWDSENDAQGTAVSYLFKLLYLIGDLGAYAIDHPMQTLTYFLMLQMMFAQALNSSRSTEKRFDTLGIPPEFQVNDQPFNSTNPKVAVYGQNFAFVYTAPGVSGTDIFVRKYDQFAQALGPSSTINTDTTNDQDAVAVSCSANRCRALWQSLTPNSLNDIIYGEFDTDWNPVTTQVTFNTFNSIAADQTDPTIVSLPTGESLGGWTTSNMDGSGKGINVRRISSSGTPIGSDATLNSFISNDQDSLTMTVSNTRIAAAWRSKTGVEHPNRDGIRGTTVFFNGTVVTPDVFLGDPNDIGSQTNPSIGSNGAVNFLTYEFNSNIRGRFLNQNLQPTGSSFTVNTDTNGVQRDSNVVNLPNGNFLATYLSNSTGVFRIMGQEITPAGAFVGSEVPMNTDNTNPQASVDARSFSSGPINLVMTNTRVTQGTSGVFARAYNSTNIDPPPATTSVPVTTSAPATTQSSPSPSSSGTTNFFATTSIEPPISTTGVIINPTNGPVSPPGTPSPAPAANENIGPIVGGVAGAAAATVGLTGGAVYLYKKLKQKKEPIRKNKGNTKIGNFELLNSKLNREQAQQFYEATGIKLVVPDDKEFVKYEVLGSGNFGKIKLAWNTKKKILCVVKKIKDNAVNESLNEPEMLKELSAAGESNITGMYAAYSDKDKQKNPAIYQFMPILGFGSGYTFQKCLSRVKEEPKRILVIDALRQMLTAVDNIHKEEHGITHNDIKLGNIMYDLAGNLKLIDFGCAVKTKSKKITEQGYRKGDSRFFPPERYMSMTYDGEKADVWAVGVAILEMMDEYPFPSVGPSGRIGKWNEAFFENFFKESYPKLVNPENDGLFVILKGILAPKAEDRLTAKKALELLTKLYPEQLTSEKRKTIFDELRTVRDNPSAPIVVDFERARDQADLHYQRGEAKSMHNQYMNNVGGEGAKVYSNKKGDARPKKGSTPFWKTEVRESEMELNEVVIVPNDSNDSLEIIPKGMN